MKEIWLKEAEYAELKEALSKGQMIKQVADKHKVAIRYRRSWLVRYAKLIELSRNYKEFRMFYLEYNRKGVTKVETYQAMLKRVGLLRRKSLREELIKRGLIDG